MTGGWNVPRYSKQVMVAVIVLVFCAEVPAIAQPGAKGPEFSVELHPATDGAVPGGTLRVALVCTLSPGWHMNANKPLDEFLIPTELQFKPEDNIPLNPPSEGDSRKAPLTVKSVGYPPARQVTLSFSPDPLAVYEGTFVLGVDIAVAADAAPGTQTLHGILRYQACNDKSCMPPVNKVVELPVKILAAGTTPVPLEGFVEPNGPDAAKAVAEATPAPVPPPPPASSAPPAPAPPVPSALAAPPPPPVVPADWRALADQFTVAGRLDGYTNAGGFVSFIAEAERGGPTGGNTLAGKSLWLMLALVLGGGLLLNLTPCVLPLIPINVAIIGAGARAGSRARGFALGGAYGLGIALVYGALGLVVVLGVSSAFGAINSTVWFNALIAALFVALALAMFDVFEIDFSRFQAAVGIRSNEGGSFPVALAMGALSALLAGACVAPVVISTILQAQDLYSQGHTAALALPFVLGAGMALPWPFLGAGLSFLPKPGKWMVRVKQAFGVFILLFALYYGHIAHTLWSPATPAAGETDKNGWTISLEEGLARGLAEKKPVIIDFWATWCKNCSVMDRTVLRDSGVIKRLDGYVKVKYQAEELTAQPTKDIAERFQVLGLPTYVILKPKG
jgi:cytochrome c biogenesis protein CcdA/thiol-disulfide isomerase/thioredoxin